MDDVKKDSFPRLPKLELIFSKNYSRARCTTVQFVMILTAFEFFCSAFPKTKTNPATSDVDVSFSNDADHLTTQKR